MCEGNRRTFALLGLFVKKLLRPASLQDDFTRVSVLLLQNTSVLLWSPLFVLHSWGVDDVDTCGSETSVFVLCFALTSSRLEPQQQEHPLCFKTRINILSWFHSLAAETKPYFKKISGNVKILS